MGEPGPVVVVGVGNDLRGDDGAGVAVARALRRRRDLPAGVTVLEEQGETVGLLDRWAGCRALVLVDAVRSGAPPGTVTRLDASATPLPATVRGSTSSHHLGLHEAIELARAVGRLPPRVVVHAVEGTAFEAGAPLSDPVRAALPGLVDAVLAELRA